MHWIEKHRSTPGHFKSKATLWFVFLLITMSGLANHAAAQDAIKVVQTVGSGTIRGNDISSARNNAFSEAMAASVQQALAEIMTIESMISNFQKLDELFFENIEDYILEYKVLSENISGQTYRALMETTVLTKKIKEKMGSLEISSSQTGFPNVVLFITEQNIGDILPLYWWGEEPTFKMGYAERAMAKALTEQGFSIFDHEGMLLDYHNYPPQKNAAGLNTDSRADKSETGENMTSIHFDTPYLTPEQAIELGRYLEADIVVKGTALAQIVPNLKDETIRSFKANLTVKAFRVDNSDQIASVDRQAVTIGTDEQSGGRDALSNAGTLAGKAFVSQITPGWTNAETRPRQIEILVKGTSALNHFVILRNGLSEIPDVRNLQVKEIRHNQAILGANYTKSTQTLAESLMQKTFDNFEVNIFEITPERISLEIN